MIYDILLLSPQKIAISPIRRQQPVDGFICPACSTSHSKKPEPVWRPETAILRTCKQIDFEATRILYRMNDFYLSCKSGRPTCDEPSTALFWILAPVLNYLLI